MKIMAIDYGAVRTGVAVSDYMGILASPVCVINETNRKKLIEKIAQLSIEHKAEKILVGLPKNMDATEGKSAQNCRLLAKEIALKTGVEVLLTDERNTTKSASLYLNQTDTRGKKRKEVIDAVAATIILQAYLDSSLNK